MSFWLLLLMSLSVLYTWYSMWFLGYHGVFCILIFMLFLIFYFNYWGLYLCWLLGSDYCLTMYNWVDLGNILLFSFSLSSTMFSTSLMIIMSGGSVMVLTFVYLEMWDDKEGSNFAIILMGFLSFMILLMLSDNLIMFYLGWEGIGIMSLFLVSFWSERQRSLKATMKVFSINKMGDLLLLMCMSLYVGFGGLLSFTLVGTSAILLLGQWWEVSFMYMSLLDMCCMLMVIGGGVKSSQFGFHLWLLEAMEAPLGASALMHSSTLVVAGIILVFKLYSLIVYSYYSLGLLIIWGSWTSLFAAFIACYQYEVKVMLAYSTISSMGFMYLLLGLGAITEFLVYFIFHAFIKIFLFLVIGLIIFLVNGVQDMRWMGGLFNYFPYIWALYIGGTIGLGGLPYWSGYYCKSYLLLFIDLGYNYYSILHIMVGCSTLFGYVYLIRLGWLMFGGYTSGHYKIYAHMQLSFVIIMMFGVMCIFSMYLSNVWLMVINWTTELSSMFEYSYSYIGLNLLPILGFASWGLLGLVYINMVCFFMVWRYFDTGLSYSFLYGLYWYMAMVYFMMMWWMSLSSVFVECLYFMYGELVHLGYVELYDVAGVPMFILCM